MEKNMKKFAVLIVLINTLLFGCSTGQKMSNLRESMSKQEVVELLGDPDGFKRSGEYEWWQYSHRLVRFGGNGEHADYNLILKNGKLVEWGTGEVRQNPSLGGFMFLVPLR